jgi:alkylated DNA nucleotide flippase Atl1
MTPKQIGAVIRKARGKRSYRDVAKEAGCTHKQVKWVEEGTLEFTTLVQHRVAKAVGVTIKAEQ